MGYINQIILGHALNVLPKLPAESVNCVTCSPPYWSLRDYGIDPVIWGGDKDCKHEWGNKAITLKHKSGETNPGKEGWFKNRGASDDKGSRFCLRCNAWRGSLGLEPTFELYIKHLCDIFDGVKRVLRKDGTCWVNLGDTYGGSGGDSGKTIGSQRRGPHGIDTRPVGISGLEGNQKSTRGYEKCLLDIPYHFSIEMTNRGWVKRNTIIWWKPNCMPSSANDRFTIDFEYLFFFTKSNKTLFWINEKTLECISKKPLGVKGIEGKDWEWKEVGNYEGTDAFNVRVRDSDKNKFSQKASPSEIARKYGYEPEEICPICGRTWKRHASPNAKDRKEGIKREFIPCTSTRKTKISGEQAEDFGSPRARYHRKSKLKKVSLWRGHDYWFEQQFEEYKESTYLRAQYGGKSKKTDMGIHGGMTLKSQHEAFRKIREGESQGANKRCVWIIPTQPFPEAHFAVYPEGLIEIPIKAGCPEFICKKCGKARVKIYQGKSENAFNVGARDTKEGRFKEKWGTTQKTRPHYEKYKGDKEFAGGGKKFIGYSDCGCGAGFESGIVLDPFIGAGTTAKVAIKQRKRFTGIDIKKEYIEMSKRGIAKVQSNLF